MDLIPPLRCNDRCQGNVPRLTAFVAAAKQYYHYRPTPLEINPVAWAVVDLQLRDAFADRLHIARIPGRQPLQPDLNTRNMQAKALSGCAQEESGDLSQGRGAVVENMI